MARERYSGAWERGFAAQVAVQAHFESSPGLPSFFGHLTATLAELLGARIVLFGRLDADGRLLTLQPRAHGLSDDQIVALGAIPVAPDAPGLASRVVYGGVVFRGELRPDDPEVAPWRGVLTALDAADAVAVSWRAADQPLGILVALGSTRAGFSEDDAHVLQTAAEATAMVWRNNQRSESRLREVHGQAEDANREITAYVHEMVHELRVPLAVVGGYADILASGKLKDRASWSKPLRAILDQTREMGDLIDALLLAARLDAGHETAQIQHVDLRDLVQEAVRRARPRARVASTAIADHVPRAPVTAAADPAHTKRILDNLINNAILYAGPHASVSVSAATTDAACVIVEDDGPGVPADMLEHVFERFVRVEDRSRHPGTGLGLYICRRLAAEQGGTLALEPGGSGRSSRFVLRLPRP